MSDGGETNWIPGLVVLGAGAAAALFFLLGQRKKTAPSSAASITEELDARYERLLGQLKAHSGVKHQLSPEAWAQEQQRLESEAAAVLREKSGAAHAAVKAEARAEGQASAPAAPPAPQTFLDRNPALRGGLIGGAVALFFMFLGNALTQESTARKDDMPPQGMGQGAQQPPADPALEAAMGRAERNPNDVDLLADAAAELIKRSMFDDAVPIIARATSLDPYHVRTRVWRGVLKAVEGKQAQALPELEHLADAYEDAYEARLYAGALAAELQQDERALRSFERYLAEAPDAEHPPMLRRGVAELQTRIASKGAVPAPGPAPTPAPPAPAPR